MTSRRRSWSAHLALALVCYVPLLLTRRGQVVADTKQYLALDPVGMLEASTSLWDPDWALGTVTHQSIGYLWPMAPWFALMESLGLPVWMAQRLWLGSILFAAATGLLFLGRRFGWSVEASAVAGCFYALSPYALSYATRMSALIMPWAALPWLIGFAFGALRSARAGRLDRWRDPARLALVATTVGAINASSLIYVGLAVIAWFPFAVWSAREATVRDALTTMIRIGTALTLVSLWWAVALVVQAGWGPDVLRFSETLEVVASGSPASEAWRGLGYWIFYGGDRTGLWVGAAEPYTQNVVVVAITYLLALGGLAALLFVRWRYRVFTLGLAVAGLVLTIGLHPYADPSPLGRVVTDSAAESSLALALRSSPRAMPLFLLAVACSLAAGIDAIDTRRFERARLVAGGAALLLTAASILPLWTGSYVGDELARDETLPESWRAAADHLNQGDPNHRILILPGSDFSAHRWGNTIDHILPGIVDRPVAVRELIPYGSSASADLLIALDRRAQERLLQPSEVAPIARLLGAGDVLVQSDLEFERYRTPRPDDLWRILTDPAAGFAAPVPFGPTTPIEASSEFPMIDEVRFGLPADLESPPPVATLPVVDPLGVIRVRPAAAPMVVAGDGESLVDLAGAGLLDPDRLILYEASMSDAEWAAALDAGATVVISDGNRLRARRWKSIRDNVGMTESLAGDGLAPDPTDARLDVFPDATADSATVAVLDGIVARSGTYGNPISYHSEDRAFHAVDGDPSTSWRAGSFTEARGEWLELELPEPAPSSVLRVRQPTTLDPNRTITELAVSVDGAAPTTVILDERSTTPEGQPLDLGLVPSSTVRLTVVETSAGDRPGYGGLSGVGFSEVWFDGEPGPGAEYLALPTSVAGRPTVPDTTNAVIVALSRDRVDPSSPVRDDPQTAIRRQVELPTERTFEITGSLRPDGRADSGVVAAALRTLGGQTVDTYPIVTSPDTIPGPLTERAGAMFDGDPSTVWRTPLGGQNGHRFTIDLGTATTLDHLGLVLAADERHSLPTGFRIESDTGEVRTIAVPPVDTVALGQTTPLELAFDPMTASTLTVTVTDFFPRLSIDWYPAGPVELPIGVAEIEIDGAQPTPLADAVVDACRDDLVSIDGTPVPVRLSGSLTDALNGVPLRVVGCEPIRLGPGTHRVEGSDRATGLSLDQLVLLSPADGAPSNEAVLPEIRSIEPGRSTNEVVVSAGDEPFWLVLGQSHSEGWEASVDGVSLGPARLVDGFANGWLVDPAVVGDADELVVTLEWVPNRTVRFGLISSAVAAVLAVVVGFVRRPRQAPATEPTTRVGWEPRAIATPRLVVLCLVAAVVVAGFTTLWLGPVMAALVFAGRRAARGRWVIALVALGSLALTGAYVTALQAVYGAPHDGAWPSLWGRAHLLGLVAIVALAAEWVVAASDRRIDDAGSAIVAEVPTR